MTLSTFGRLWNKLCFKVLSGPVSGFPEYELMLGWSEVAVGLSVGGKRVGGPNSSSGSDDFLQEATGGKTRGPAISTKATLT